VVPGTCATCHNGSTATGKPASHFATTRTCDACHNTTRWIPATSYMHLSPNYKQHGGGVTCRDCHTNNSEQLAWPYPAYKPDCAGCHANRFKPDPHTKVASPKILYTVSELKNCAGSCHVYTNATLTTISKQRSNEHRPTGDF
jgi:hypothetical protein